MRSGHRAHRERGKEREPEHDAERRDDQLGQLAPRREPLPGQRERRSGQYRGHHGASESHEHGIELDDGDARRRQRDAECDDADQPERESRPPGGIRFAGEPGG